LVQQFFAGVRVLPESFNHQREETMDRFRQRQVFQLNEKPFILFPVGYPAESAKAPDIKRKAVEEIVQWNWEGACFPKK
jgi:hypothetical protein